MKALEQIRIAFAAGNYELTSHALHRVVERNIARDEIIEAGSSAIEIEDYPSDKYYPSCLLLGFSHARRPLHLHVSRMDTECVRLITLYQPNEMDWTEGFTKRR